MRTDCFGYLNSAVKGSKEISNSQYFYALGSSNTDDSLQDIKRKMCMHAEFEFSFSIKDKF